MTNTTPARTAVVVGGASGIGLATAAAFASRGDSVVIADLDGDRAAEAARKLGGSAASHRVDVTDESSVTALFERFGDPDYVVNTAGLNFLGPVTEQRLDQWRTVLDVCLTGAFLVIKHAAQHMSPGGSIVNISSLNGKQAATGMSAYCSAKAGLEMLTQVSALELGPRGIRVNAVAPGIIQTPLVAPIFALPGMPEEFRDNTPLGRFGTTEDVAAAVLFLCTPDSWTTGETLAVDGGARMRRYPGLWEALAIATTGNGK